MPRLDEAGRFGSSVGLADEVGCQWSDPSLIASRFKQVNPRVLWRGSLCLDSGLCSAGRGEGGQRIQTSWSRINRRGSVRLSCERDRRPTPGSQTPCGSIERGRLSLLESVALGASKAIIGSDEDRLSGFRKPIAHLRAMAGAYGKIVSINPATVGAASAAKGFLPSTRRH